MRIGIDLGGTKIAAVALDDDGTIHGERRVPTPKDYGVTLEVLAGLVHALESELRGPASVGIGTPGASCRRTGLMRYAENTALEGRPFVNDINARLGREVRVTNDANCFALSEAADGAGAGAEVVVGVILGTGVGAGLVIRGHTLEGTNGLAGEWGHTPLPWPTDDERILGLCTCGKSSCIEMFLAGPGLAADHLRVTGQSATAAAIAADAREGDTQARATLQRFLGRLARSLGPLISLLDPDAIVFGGGVSKIAEIYAELPPLLAPWIPGDLDGTRILPSRHGDASGVRGAAWLWSLAGWREGLPGGGENIR